MWHLTGGIAVDLDVEHFNDWTKEKTGFYFKLLKELSEKAHGKRRVVMCASNRKHSDGSEKTEQGIFADHAYSLLDVQEVRNSTLSSTDSEVPTGFPILSLLIS